MASSLATLYRGRLAPTPSGWLHLGHAATFACARDRCRAAGGTLVMRIEDLDPLRCRTEFTSAALEDLRWYGLDWDEGPDCGGPFSPYLQSQRRSWHATILSRLQNSGCLYPSPHSRKAILAAAPKTSPVDGEAIFPPSLRLPPEARPTGPTAWRFRVPDGQSISFTDQRLGPVSFVAGRDFGDFIVWRKDDIPAYELAVVADDHAMEISEVVRGEDLLLSTARQLLLYTALRWHPPAWYHAPLILDSDTGRRLSKSVGSRPLRSFKDR